jgi:DNA-binding Xre family transcriptional regulator
MRVRGLSAYGLGKGAGITYPTAYRLARETGDFSRLEKDTLNRLCQFFRVQPGELIEWVPDGEEGLLDSEGCIGDRPERFDQGREPG